MPTPIATLPPPPPLRALGRGRDRDDGDTTMIVEPLPPPRPWTEPARAQTGAAPQVAEGGSRLGWRRWAGGAVLGSALGVAAVLGLAIGFSSQPVLVPGAPVQVAPSTLPAQPAPVPLLDSEPVAQVPVSSAAPAREPPELELDPMYAPRPPRRPARAVRPAQRPQPRAVRPTRALTYDPDELFLKR